VKLDSVHSSTETFFIFQEILRAKSDAGASMQLDRRPMALPYSYGRRLQSKAQGLLHWSRQVAESCRDDVVSLSIPERNLVCKRDGLDVWGGTASMSQHPQPPGRLGIGLWCEFWHRPRLPNAATITSPAKRVELQGLRCSPAEAIC
jgi:hypothetical protein